MSFLFPSILWGLFATIIPLIIHLASKRTSKTVEFPSLIHLKSLETESIKKLKVIEWLLVLLRMLIIACLVLVFSGPIQKNKNSAWVASSTESIAVVIIDNSASLGVKKNSLSHLEKNLSTLPSIFSSFDGVTHLKIFQTNPPKMIFDDIIEEGVQFDFKNLQVSQSMGYDNLWTFTDSLLKSIEDELPNQECFVLSDFQSLPPSGFAEFHKSWQFYVTKNEFLRDNLSVSSISTTGQIKQPNQLLKIKAKIQNSGLIEKNNIPIELYLNENRIGQIVSNFSLNSIKEYQFESYPAKAGVVKGSIEIDKDEFRLDNKKTFELYIPEQISCKVITSNIEDSFLIRTVLESINGESDFLDIELKEMQSIDAIFLDQTDVLILVDPPYLSSRSIQSIKVFLQNGGSILWFSGKNYQSLDQDLMSNLFLPTYLKTVSVQGESFFTVEIVDRQNPIFNQLNLREPELSLPKIFKYNLVKLNQSHKSILSMNNGDSFISEIKSYDGQILFLTSPLDLKWNDFALKGLLIPLIHRTLVLGATDEFNTTPVLIDQIKKINIPNESINQRWKLITPSKKEITVVPNYQNEQIEIKNTSELGSYDLYFEDDYYTSFSTFLSKFESPQIRADLDELIDQFNDTMITILDGQITEKIKANRFGQSMWRLFLILAIIFYLIESVISRPAKKQANL